MLRTGSYGITALDLEDDSASDENLVAAKTGRGIYARGAKSLGTKDNPIDLDKVTVKLEPGIDADTVNRFHQHTPSLASSIVHE